MLKAPLIVQFPIAHSSSNMAGVMQRAEVRENPKGLAVKEVGLLGLTCVRVAAD